jgi:hypothetical protein
VVLRAERWIETRIGRRLWSRGDALANLDMDRGRSKWSRLMRLETRPTRRRNRSIKSILLLHRGCALTFAAVAHAAKCGVVFPPCAVAIRPCPELSTALSRPNHERRIGRLFSQSVMIHRGHGIFSSGSTSASRGAMHDLHPISPHFAGSTM